MIIHTNKSDPTLSINNFIFTHIHPRIKIGTEALENRKTGKQVDNKNYLYADMFINQFYDPANAILGDRISCFIFEQEYQRKSERIASKQFAEDLEVFIESLPKDDRYYFEIRTDYYQTYQYFDLIQMK